MKIERQAAVEAILSAGHIPAGMELFSAGSETQLQTIYRWIDSSDVYLLLVGGRYGSVESESGLSYTELEFNYASETGKQTFSVVFDEDYLNEKIRLYGASIIERKCTDLFEAFKARVLQRTTAIVGGTESAKFRILQSLSECEKNSRLVGWIRADETVVRSCEMADTRGVAYSEFPCIPALTDNVSVGVTAGTHAKQSITLQGSWQVFLLFFIESLDISVSEWNGERHFSINEFQSRRNFAHALVAALQGYAVPNSQLWSEDFERLKAYYIESGLMLDGEGNEPFTSEAKRISRRLRIHLIDMAGQIALRDGVLPLEDPDDDIPF